MRHAATSATRVAAFPADEPLDGRGLDEAGALAGALPWKDAGDVLAGPARRCRQTAEAAGLGTPQVQAGLAECDFGRWRGRTLEDVHAADPQAGVAWMTDPEAAPHGGESLAVFAARVAGWLDEQSRRDGRGVAITHGGVIKAAVVHALGAPVDAFWRVDVRPLGITELHAHDGRWTIRRMNCPVPG